MYTMADIQRSVRQSSWSQIFLGASTCPGLGTTPHPELRQFANLPMRSDPLEQRQGEPLLSESLLHTLLTSCTLSNSMHPADANNFNPQYARTPYLESSLGTDSTMPSGHLSSLTAPTHPGSVQRVSEAIRLAAEARSQARGPERHAQPFAPHPHNVGAAEAVAVTVPSTPMRPDPIERRVYESPSVLQPTGAEMPSREDSSSSYEVVPHSCDGDERSCTLCQEEFLHGQRVCRLTCGHMYHAICCDSLVIGVTHRDWVSCPTAVSWAI